VLVKKSAIRTAYEKYGVTEFYHNFGDHYRNPHEASIVKIIEAVHATGKFDFSKVLDLASGSGEVTLALQTLGYTNVDAIEPYTFNAYLERTNKPAEQYRFEDIEQGILSERFYSLIICSFALHLVESSRLPTLSYQLSRIAPSLIVITPHKKPILKTAWGWRLLNELQLERVRARLYLSTSIF
jgi:SAM-dependent methyltransferase